MLLVFGSHFRSLKSAEGSRRTRAPSLRAPGFRCGFRSLPLGQPPFLALRRAASALAALVARPAWAATTAPMLAPQRGHLSLLMAYQESANADNPAQRDGYSKPESALPLAARCPLRAQLQEPPFTRPGRRSEPSKPPGWSDLSFPWHRQPASRSSGHQPPCGMPWAMAKSSAARSRRFIRLTRFSQCEHFRPSPINIPASGSP